MSRSLPIVVTPAVIELAPTERAPVTERPGYGLQVWDCFLCSRDFRLHAPRRQGFAFVLTQGVPCPYCRHEAEVYVQPGRGPVYVEPIRESWWDWRVRAIARRIELLRRKVCIAAGAQARSIRRMTKRWKG